MKRTGFFLKMTVILACIATGITGITPAYALQQKNTAVDSNVQSNVNSKVNYYRIDKVKTIRGEIIRVNTEKCYEQNDYTVIYLKEKKSQTVYRVEVSPLWFFEVDLMTGSRIEVTGSVNKTGNVNHVMTRSIMFRGELYEFRDKHGFPLWRGKGGQRNRSGYGKGRRKHGQRGSY